MNFSFVCVCVSSYFVCLDDIKSSLGSCVARAAFSGYLMFFLYNFYL